MSFRDFKVFTFDVVGTLIDFEAGILRAVLKALADAVERNHGAGLVTLGKAGRKSHDHRHRTAEEGTRPQDRGRGRRHPGAAQGDDRHLRPPGQGAGAGRGDRAGLASLLPAFLCAAGVARQGRRGLRGRRAAQDPDAAPHVCRLHLHLRRRHPGRRQAQARDRVHRHPAAQRQHRHAGRHHPDPPHFHAARAGAHRGRQHGVPRGGEGGREERRAGARRSAQPTCRGGAPSRPIR